jgi:hypothetical protein
VNNLYYARGQDAVIELWDYVEQRKRDCWIDAGDIALVLPLRGTWSTKIARADATKWYAIGKQWRSDLHRCETVLMHRWIMNATDPSKHVHHIDNDGLNNRRSNLSVVTPKQNSRAIQDRDWDQKDKALEIAELYRRERRIARQVQEQFGITRMQMHNIRSGDIGSGVKRSGPAEAYREAIRTAELKTLAELKAEWPKDAAHWGVYCSGSRW